MNSLEHFHFLRPLWLLAMPTLILAIVLIYRFKRQQSGWQPILPKHLLPYLVNQTSNKGANRATALLLVTASILSSLALSGPSWEKLPQPVFQLHQGRVLVIDLSISMRATDMTPNRLSRAKFKAIDLIKQFDEGETGLVVYAGDAFTISPLSSDSNNLLSMIPSLSPEIMPVAGDEPEQALILANQLLTNAGYQNGDIFWITDGIKASQLLPLQKQVEKSRYRVSILGVGTAEGAPITAANGELYKDNLGNIVVPQMAARHLLAISNKSGGNFTTLANDDSDIKHLISSFEFEANTAESEQESENKGDQWRDAGFYLVLLLAPIVLYLFRRGAIYCLCIVLTLPLMTRPSYAFDWQSLWKTKDQQAALAFAKKDYASASRDFNDLRWKGVSQYKAGNYQQAAEIFAQLPDADGQYNLGNAELKQGNLEQAIAAYQSALEGFSSNEQPSYKNALHNKKIAEELLQQQQQNQQGDDDQSDDNKDDQQSSNDNKEQQSQQDQNQDQQSSDEDNQQQSQSDNSESEEQQQQQQDSQQEQGKNEQQQQQNQQAEEPSEDNAKGDEQTAQMEQRELTEAEKEQQQQMQLLMNKVTDDPAFLLKKRMALEYQKRKYDTRPR